jgi:glycosyltransferase 2 family protein
LGGKSRAIHSDGQRGRLTGVMNPKIKRILFLVYRLGFYVIPVVILAVVFQKIDLQKLKENILQTNPWILIIGMSYYPVAIFFGGLRWRVATQIYFKRKIPVFYMIKHYWIGFSLGIFMPASVGWDIYKGVVASRKFGKTILSFTAIVAEKFIALITLTFLIILIFPSVKKHLISTVPDLDTILLVSYSIVFGFILMMILVRLGLFKILAHRIVSRIENFLSRSVNKMLRVVKMDIKFGKVQLSFKDIVEPVLYKNSFIYIMFFSVATQMLAAVGNQILFRAVGYDLPITVNMFLLPVFTFIFILPISFGSLGIREGAFILLYGLFGVPAETALLISFFNLFGILINNAIGGVLLFLNRPARISRSADA